MTARSEVTPLEALRRLIEACKLVSSIDCETLDIWNKFQGELGVAEGVVRDFKSEPVAHLRFRAAQQFSGVGGHDIEYAEWLETCHEHEIGDDKLPAFPVYAAPAAAVSAAPSGEVERAAIMEEAAKLCDFQATWAKGEADDEENSVRYRHENRERQTAAELCAASIRAAATKE